MKVRHNLPVLMAKRKIKSIAHLSRMTRVDRTTLYNFNNYIHKKIDPELTVILCQTLKCDIGDLFYLSEED
ncbi:helix-turn-helix domain-containing protein [Aneurinibacillus migulanus]|uniref:helix-turn-helix domain-containing protein n=1 Tax=Aneurinibacillus migulanus TaxID=47500 RepID=UPI00209EF88C|nr:helix-turn-helix transcriptional regulator [Aneurinibacillus migulanus]MCP1355054.1 helix-turn-helix transcriptional regulator [Aneurinibacillus migulanus]